MTMGVTKHNRESQGDGYVPSGDTAEQMGANPRQGDYTEQNKGNMTYGQQTDQIKIYNEEINKFGKDSQNMYVDNWDTCRRREDSLHRDKNYESEDIKQNEDNWYRVNNEENQQNSNVVRETFHYENSRKEECESQEEDTKQVHKMETDESEDNVPSKNIRQNQSEDNRQKEGDNDHIQDSVQNIDSVECQKGSTKLNDYIREAEDNERSGDTVRNEQDQREENKQSEQCENNIDVDLDSQIDLSDVEAILFKTTFKVHKHELFGNTDTSSLSDENADKKRHNTDTNHVFSLSEGDEYQNQRTPYAPIHRKRQKQRGASALFKPRKALVKTDDIFSSSHDNHFYKYLKHISTESSSSASETRHAKRKKLRRKKAVSINRRKWFDKCYFIKK